MGTKTIWMCWFQGNDNIPELNQVCIKRWKKLNPDWNVIILNYNNIKEYVPGFFKILNNSKSRIMAHQADLLRMLLLSKYGGVWVDASVYPMLPLSNFYDKIMNETGFFTYRFIPRGGHGTNKLETVVWFLCVDRPNHYLINKWKNKLIYKYKNKNRWHYFEFGHTLTQLYDNDEKIKFIIENMVQMDQRIPHSACKDITNKKKSFMYKRPITTVGL